MLCIRAQPHLWRITMDPSPATQFLVKRNELRRTRFVADEVSMRALADGEVRLRVASFALTSNNITYAAFGESMRYFDFFPSPDAQWGRIPVWGFAEVAESRCTGVSVGERLYGYLPIGTHVIVSPVRVDARGFVDGVPHRRELHAVYNQYLRCASDPLYRNDREGEQALLRPLFVTSLLIDDFIVDNAGFGARNVLLSSASSKTAYGTAFCLSQRRGTLQALQVIGLTSPGNVEFSESLGCYDLVVPYDALPTLPSDVPTVYVDFSGGATLRGTIHRHFGDRLRYSCAVGGTHWDDLGGAGGLPGTGGLPGPRPILFFAPAQIKKRSGDWGRDGLQQRIADAWHAFMATVADGPKPWLKVVWASGPEAITATYLELLDGKTSPRQGHMLSP
jgi:Protein of unknown function (DUF2855)